MIDELLLSSAAHAAPELDPATTVAVATSASDPVDAAGRAQATAQYQKAATAGDVIARLPHADQAAVFASHTPSEQQQMMAAGYRPPKDTSGGGFFSDIGHFLGSVAHDVNQHLVKPVEQVPGAFVHDAGDVLNGLGSGLRFVQHAYRAGHVLGETSAMQSNPKAGQAGVLSSQEGSDFLHSFGGIFSPSAWARAWRQTTNGEATFEPSVLRQLNGQVPANIMHLALAVASGEPEQQIVAGYPAAQRQQIISTIHSDPTFAKTLQTLQASKISLGRNVVGEKYLVDHGHYDPTTHQFHDPISGSIDAAFDFAGDPTMRAGALIKGVQAAKWGIDAQRAAAQLAPDATAMEHLLNPDNVQAGMHRVLQMTPVQRAVKVAGDLLSKGDGQKLETYFPNSLGRIWPTLVSEGVDSPEKLQTWLSSQAGVKAILTGNAARISRSSAIVPHLSMTGWAKATAKGWLKDSVDQIADKPSGLAHIRLSPDDVLNLGTPGALAEGRNVVNLSDMVEPTDSRVASAFQNGAGSVARFVRQASTLVPTTHVLDLTDPQAVQQLDRAMAYSLPARARASIANAWVSTSDISKRFSIAKGALAQMLHLAGAYSTQEGADASDKMLQALDEQFHKGVFSTDGRDGFADGSRAGLLDNQLSTQIHLPNLSTVRKAVRADAVLRPLGIPIPGGHVAMSLWNHLTSGAERFMNIWRPSVLLRAGFPVRIALDENGNYVLRKGVAQAVAVRAMHQAVKTDAIATARRLEEDPQLSPWARAINTVAHHVPGQVLGEARSMRDLASAVFGEAAYQTFGRVGRLAGISRQELYDAAAHVYDNWDGIGPLISAVHHGAAGYDDLKEMINVVTDGKVVPVKWRDTGMYSEATAGDPLWRLKWHHSLGQIASSKLGSAVLDAIESPTSDQVANVRALLEAPAMDEIRARSVRSWKLPDGRIVGVDATEGDALDAWARKVVDHVNSQVRSSDGTLLGDVVDEMRNAGDAPSMDTLGRVAQRDLPSGTFGPDLMPVHPAEKLLATGMNSVAHMIDWLVRQPNFTYSFAKARKELAPIARAYAGEGENADALLNDMAWHRATNDLKPFIHSPEMKTQFELMHRTAMPFLFAQRQFLMRWARTFSDSPEAIRKIQLGMNGLRTSGVVHKDSQGNDVFVYPGTAAVTHLLSETLGHFGIGAYAPLNEPFTGQVKYIMPGLSNPVTPSLGPFAAIPLKALTGMFPELQGPEQALLGQGASTGMLEQVLPSVVTRVLTAVQNPGMNVAGGEWASMLMKSIQDLAANGQGLPANPSNKQIAAYQRRLIDTTRLNLFMRAAYGFAMPASPTMQVDPKDFSARYSQLLKELPYNQALTELLKENPNAYPFTVAMSKSAGGAPLPAAKAAGRWLTRYGDFVTAHPKAAGWFIPRSTGNGPFDPATYREQIQIGLRSDKTPQQFLDDVTMAPGLNEYYQAYDMVHAAEQGASSAAKAQIRQVFDQWSQSFFKQNPLVQDYIQSGDKTTQRAQTIRDLNAAINDDKAPSTPQATHVATMVLGYDQVVQAIARYQGNYSSSAQSIVKQIEAVYDQWATAYAQANPDVSELWTVLLRPQMSAVAGGYAFPVTGG